MSTGETDHQRASSSRWEWIVAFYPVHVLGMVVGGGARVSLDQGIQNVLNDWEQKGIEFVQLVPTPVGDYFFVGRRQVRKVFPRPPAVEATLSLRPEGSEQTPGPEIQDLTKEAEPQSITQPTEGEGTRKKRVKRG